MPSPEPPETLVELNEETQHLWTAPPPFGAGGLPHELDGASHLRIRHQGHRRLATLLDPAGRELAHRLLG
jgi:hypothetical protein